LISGIKPTSASANRPPVIDWVSSPFGGAVAQTFQWLN
jgi:hypothetical protein